MECLLFLDAKFEKKKNKSPSKHGFIWNENYIQVYILTPIILISFQHSQKLFTQMSISVFPSLSEEMPPYVKS